MSELNEALRERLNLPDVAAMPAVGAVPMAAAPAPAEAEEEAPATQTSFKAGHTFFFTRILKMSLAAAGFTAGSIAH